MFKKMSVCMVVLAILSVNAQMINLQGVVSNSAGKPIANAIVSLVRQKLKDTTGTDGKYAFSGTPIKKLPDIAPITNDISLSNDVLQFALKASSPMKIEIFDLKGNLLRQEINMNAPAGMYRFNISKNCKAANVLVIKAAIGSSEVSFRYIPLNGGRYSLNLPNAVSTISSSNGLAKMAADVDTLTVSATGFQTKSIALTSLDNQQQNVTLDSSSTNGKNAPGPSVGCGKDLGSLKSGTYFITSAGLKREYIIQIPANYDKNKPYRLIFAMHCMCGSAEKVAGTNDQSANFYGLKPLAAKDNIPVIFVAPSAYAADYSNNAVSNGCIVWSQQDKDHTFFEDMLKLFKEQLCVDTTRVFSCGFSFGAMFTYSLSTAYQKELRAVATYAPANFNIYLPTNKHLPIAYMSTTGTNDGRCPWINPQNPKTEGGKFCVLNHAVDNGCDTSVTIKLTTNGTHVVTEFQKCKDGYPVKFCSFQGDHQCNATDQGTNFDWIPVETWEFFMRF